MWLLYLHFRLVTLPLMFVRLRLFYSSDVHLLRRMPIGSKLFENSCQRWAVLMWNRSGVDSDCGCMLLYSLSLKCKVPKINCGTWKYCWKTTTSDTEMQQRHKSTVLFNKIFIITNRFYWYWGGDVRVLPSSLDILLFIISASFVVRLFEDF